MIKRNQTMPFYFDFGIIGYQDVLVIYDWIDGEEAKEFDAFDLPVIKAILFCNNEKVIPVTEIIPEKFKAGIRCVIREKSH